MNELANPKDVALPGIHIENIILAGGTVVLVGKWHSRSRLRFELALQHIPRRLISQILPRSLEIHFWGGGRLIFLDADRPEKFLGLEIQGYCIMEEAWDNLDLEILLRSRMRGVYVKQYRQAESPRQSERGIGYLPASWYSGEDWQDVPEHLQLLPGDTT